MNSLERQRRLTKLLAMVQTTRMALNNLCVESVATMPYRSGDGNKTQYLPEELKDADGSLQAASRELAKLLVREIR
jgi:hypothetical protein